MTKRLISISLALSIFMSIFAASAFSAFALPAYKSGKSTSSTDVYCLPDNTSSMKIGSIGVESVKVYWAEGNSYYIEYTVSNGSYSGYKRGYVPKSKISVSGVGGIGYTSRKDHTNSNTKVYNRSNTSSLPIGTVYSTDTLTILQEDGNWYYIQYPVSGGYKRGYILKSAVSPVSFKTYGDMGWTYPLSSADTFSYISNGYKSGHKGLDIIAKTGPSINGQVIKSPASGIVKYSDEDPTAGNTIVIETNYIDPYNNHKIRVGFQHMQNKSSYKNNAQVAKGATLGKVGSTGDSSTGPHMHIYMRSDDQLWTNRAGRTINPQAFFPNVPFTGATSGTLNYN